MAKDWNRKREKALSDETPPDDWPKGVTPISVDGLDLLGLDRKLNLYWDGKPIEIKTIQLTFLQNVAVFITAASLFIGIIVGIKEIMEFYYGVSNYAQLIEVISQ